MKYTLTIIFLLPLFLINCSAQKHSKKTSFKDILNKYNLELNTPSDFREVSVKNNSNIKYQYALKHDSTEFEIRFLVTTIDTTINLSNSKAFLSLFTSVVLNASGYIIPKIPIIQELGYDFANQEYNADEIAVSSFLSKSKFTDGFNICSVIGIQKNQINAVFIFFMIKNKKKNFIYSANTQI